MTAPPPSPPSSEPTETASTAQASVERATALTEELIDRGAPWSTRTSWKIVGGEAIVAGILGLLILFRPIGGSSSALLLIGFILLVGALISAFQVWRHKIREDLEVLTAFRAGSGVTVGLVVIVATFLTSVSAAVTASLAVVIGVGFVIFGAAGIVSTFAGRVTGTPLPLPGLIVNSVLVVAGAVLMFAGAAGSSSVDGIFNLLGIVLIVAAVALGGYAYLLRQQGLNGVRRWPSRARIPRARVRITRAGPGRGRPTCASGARVERGLRAGP